MARRYTRDAEGRFAESNASFAGTIDELELEIRDVFPNRDPKPDMVNMHPDDRAQLTHQLSQPHPEVRAAARTKARADAKRERARNRRTKARETAQNEASVHTLVDSLDRMQTMDVAKYRNHADPRVSERARQILFKRS